MKQAQQKIIYETTNEIAPSHGVHNSCVVLVVHSGHGKICFDFLLPSLPSPLPSFFPFFSPLSLPSFLPSSFLDLRTTGGFDGVFNGSREHQYLSSCPGGVPNKHKINICICFTFSLNLNKCNCVFCLTCLAPETVHSRLNGLNWMSFLGLVCQQLRVGTQICRSTLASVIVCAHGKVRVLAVCI